MSEQAQGGRPSNGCVNTRTLGGFMRPALLKALVVPISAALFLGCGDEHRKLPLEPVFVVAADAHGRDAFTWSEPVWLGPVVNSTARDWRPVLSTDGRRLYFHSNRTGGLGGFDIWVSRRAGANCPWETPVNLGAPLNTARDDGDPAFTPDMHIIFFGSDEGHGGAGRGDIFISRRDDSQYDSSLQGPVKLWSD